MFVCALAFRVRLRWAIAEAKTTLFFDDDVNIASDVTTCFKHGSFRRSIRSRLVWTNPKVFFTVKGKLQIHIQMLDIYIGESKISFNFKISPFCCYF